MQFLMGKMVESKSKWVYEKIHAMINENLDGEHVLIVPEQYTVQAEKDFIEIIGCKGIINPEIISFNRLAHRVFQETGGRTRILIDDLGKHMLVKKILIDLEADLMLFSGLAREPGMIDRIVESITEFKQYEVSPEDLCHQVSMIEDDQLLKDKLNDLIQVYRRFETSLDKNYVDQEDQFLALIEQIKTSCYINRKTFWIDGFYSFTPQMLSVIKEIALHAKGINVTAYGAGDWLKTNENILTVQINQLMTDLSNDGVNCLVIDVDAYFESDCDPSIHHLSDNFTKLPIEPWTGGTDAIQMFSANNDDAEIEQVSSKILELVQEKGYRFNEISVLCANLEDRQDSIKRFFSLQKIPFFMDVRRKQIEHPLTHLVPFALDVIIRKFSNQSMMRYLKTGFSGLEIQEVEVLENEVIARGIKGMAWKREFTFNADMSKQKEINQLRQRVSKPLIFLEKSLENASNVHEMTIAVYEWLKMTKVANVLAYEIEMYMDRDDVETASMLGQLWDKINALMDQLVDLMGDTSISLMDYQNIWKTGLNSIEIGIIPPTNDQVMIGTPERSRQSGIKALFLMGINDGVLPAVPSDTGALKLYEKEWLQKQGCVVGTIGELRIAQENLMVQLALGRPKERLWLSYSLATVESEIRRPSTMIDRIKLIIPQIQSMSELRQSRAQEIQLLRSSRHSYLLLASKLREVGDGKEIFSHWSTLYKWYANQEEWDTAVLDLMSALFYQNQPEKLDSHRSKALFGKPYTGSVSRLEQYNRCPFAHYVRYGLMPVKRKELEISSPDIGSALHEMMDLFGKKIVEEEVKLFEASDTEIQLISQDIATEVMETFNDKIFNSNARFRYQGIRIKRIGCRAINTMVYQLRKSGFLPFQHELSFGLSEEDHCKQPFMIYDEHNDPVYLEGRIDRIDKWEDEAHLYYRVIDYKSGRKEFSLSDIVSGLQLQLVVYLMAALEQRDPESLKKPIKPGGLYYFYLDDPLVELQSNNEADARKKALESLKLNGITLNNTKIISEMDQLMVSDSDTIPVGFTKAGNFKKNSKILAESDFDTLQKYTQIKIIETAKEILGGSMRIDPVKVKQWKACDYCDYLRICQFDQQISNNHYNKIEPLNDEESLKKMTKALLKGGDI